MFRIPLLTSLLWILVKSQFNLYDTYRTGHMNTLQFDCLHDYNRQKALSFSNFDYVISWTIQYCLRPIDENDSQTGNFFNHPHRNLTFNELRRWNVTTEQLLLWSASIDLAEQYQDYLDRPIISSTSNQIFFNCTKPWFGSRCQYSFDLGENMSLNDIVQATFKAKTIYTFPSTVTNLTCYMHLECDRGGPPMCLDWREVCNGRVDCLNGGADEAHCFRLEVNECGENEFRCYNGLCIAKEFWRSGDHSMICPNQPLPSFLESELDNCLQYSTSRCDDRLCSPGPKQFPCGDGQCVKDFDACKNGRHHLLTQSISAQGNLSYYCWIAMACLTQITNVVDGRSCYYFIFYVDLLIAYIQSCKPLIQFPTIPVLFGHVRFLYDTRVFRNLNSYAVPPPDYVCYNEQLCDFLIPTFRNGSNTCRYGYEMGFKEGVEYHSWASIIHSIEPYFRGCLIRHNDENDSRHTSLYCCKNSSKCISKHRIVDNISDCYMEDDEEQFEMSCSLNDTYRFMCQEEEGCRSPLFPPDVCLPKNRHNLDDILFHEVCDRIVHLLPEIIDDQNHTDETECEHWQCGNIYTRCNRLENCFDGKDEENCTASICNPPSLPCVIPDNYTLTCLSADRVGDGITDCLGAADELTRCVEPYLYFPSPSLFLCWHTSNCVPLSELCNGYEACPENDDEAFCDDRHDICDKNQLPYRNSLEDALCRIGKMEKIYFSLKTSIIYPSLTTSIIYLLFENRTIDYINQSIAEHNITANDIELEHYDPTWAWRCNRGLYARLQVANNNDSYICFCPPSYYGDWCQYQNQRVFLKLGLALVDRRGVYAVVVTLIDDDDGRQEVNSYEQFVTVAGQYCGEFFDIYLLYSVRPKNDSKNYSIRVDTFDKASLAYVASWYLRIRFLFLPVNHLAVILNVPSRRGPSANNCTLKCNNGECMKYINEDKFFCRCHSGWSGAQCHILVNCSDCSSDSACVGHINNRPICVCPLTKFGPRCVLTHLCPQNFCKNNGQCVVINPSVNNQGYACICPEQFGGLTCELTKTKLEIYLNSIELSSYLLVYIITVNDNEQPLQRVMFQKLLMFQHTVTLHILDDFHIVFVKISSSYYLAVLQLFKQPNISTSISSSQRCNPINELLNSTIITWSRIRQVKYYHMLCQTQLDLVCFFDKSYMCLCTLEHHANCVKFDHKPDLTCRDDTHCQNGAECLQDQQICPLDTICICTDCYFGDRCQFYAKGIGLTLDDILRYQIRPNTTLAYQPFSVKLSAALTMLMFVSGLINSFLSFLAFQSRDSRKVGCGMYLLASTATSLLTVIMLTLKFWFLIFTQMNTSIGRSVLRGGCISIEPLLKLTLYTDSWLNACVAIERAVTVFKGVSFNKSTSKRVARWTILCLPIFIMSTIVHEPLHRNLFDDNEEQRVWCVTYYSRSVQEYNTVILFFHFLVPFSCNLLSALFIIFTVARHRSMARSSQSYKQHFREQLSEHKQLLISPLIFVGLSVPRLIISLLSGCVKLSRNPWLYLSGYFISFIPSIIIFAAFVLPSALYKKQFRETVRSWQRQIFRK